MAVKPSPQQQSFVSRFVHEYGRQSRRPLMSLTFVLPLLLLYEGGVLLLGRQAIRNGADVWLRQFLDLLGFGQYFLLPALTVGLLLAWHHTTRDRWKLSAPVLGTMFAECAVLALALVMAGRLQITAMHALATPAGAVQAPGATIWPGSGNAALVGAVLGFAGAGVYEEVLFRLLLLPPAVLCVRRLGVPGCLQVVSAVAATSLLFAAAHYVGPHGELFDGFSFWFRFIAGAVFAVLFVYRGFGIAAGTHALYDIFVSLGH